MKKCAHIIYCPFTGVGTNNGFRGNDWYKKRIEIFKKYTLKSLTNQTNKNFLLWLSFRPEEENNPYTHWIADALRFHGLEYVFTFQGLMYWDDKFNTDWKSRWANIKRIKRSQGLKTIKPYFEIFTGKNKTLQKRLEKSLIDVSAKTGDCDWVYLTRLDSDDMLHKSAVEEIQGQEPFSGALLFHRGYIYNSGSDELSWWHPKTNPPFHTIIFPAQTFFNSWLHRGYYKNFQSHEDIPMIFKTKQLSEGKYCVVIHDSHISTNWQHPFRDLSLQDTSILAEFGL